MLSRARQLVAGAPSREPIPADQIGGPRLLCFGVDALHVGFHAQVSVALREQVRFAVERLRSKDLQEGDTVVQIGGLDWIVTGGPGRAHEALLEREEGVLKLGRERQPNPSLAFEIRSATLWNLGLRGAWEWAARIAQEVHAETFGAHRGGWSAVQPVLSRIDLTCDTLNVPFAHDQQTGPIFVSSATMTEFDLPEGERGQRSFARRATYATGWSFGKGAHVARVYRKAEEITKVSGKRWFLDVWRAQSGVEVDLDRDKDRIWRVEHQLRREFLKTLKLRAPNGQDVSIDGIDALEAAIPLIWSRCCGTDTSSGWLSWRIKESEDMSRRSTWAFRREWSLVQQAPAIFGARVQGSALMLDRSRRAKAEELAKGALGYLETIASLLPHEQHGADLDRVLDWLREEALRIYAREGTNFAIEVKKKATKNNGDLVEAIKQNAALAERRAVLEELLTML
ncbi:MAG: hypothetical protein AB7T09_01770 [Planctomycetota bacterium]